MTTATLTERTEARRRAENAAELENERLSDRQKAIETLERVEAESARDLPPLKEALEQATAKVERLRKQLAAAEIAARESHWNYSRRYAELDRPRGRALHVIETTEPRWDEFIAKLREERNHVVSTYRPVEMTRNPQRDGSFTLVPRQMYADDAAYNSLARARVDALQEAIAEAQQLSRNHTVDVESEITRLWETLPTLTPTTEPAA